MSAGGDAAGSGGDCDRARPHAGQKRDRGMTIAPQEGQRAFNTPSTRTETHRTKYSMPVSF
jgi:hypothetical protein